MPILKNTFKDIFNTSIDVTKIKAAKGDIDGIAVAIKGLSAEQAVYRMRLAECSEEEIIWALRQNEVSKETIKSALAQQTNTLALQAQTRAEEKALVQKGMSTAAKEAETIATTANTAATTAGTTATTADTVATEANTAAKLENLSVLNMLKVAGSKLLAVIYANPLIAVAGAIAAISTAVIALENRYDRASERAKTAADQARDAFEQTQSEIDQLNASLETNKNKIDELNAKENLSLIESEELEKLKEANDELERELRIKESLARIEGKEANDAAVDYFNTETNALKYSDAADGGMYVIDPKRYALIDAVEQELYLIPQMKQNLKELQEQLQEIEAEDPDFVKNPYWLRLNEEVRTAKSELESFEGLVSQSIEEFAEADDSLIKGMDDGLLDRLDSIYRLYDEVINGVAQSHTNTISAVFDKVEFKGTRDQLVKLGQDGKLSVDLLSSEFSQLTQFLAGAGVSAEELYQYIMNLADPDAIKYDELKDQLKEIMGLGEGIHSPLDRALDRRLKNLGLWQLNINATKTQLKQRRHTTYE